MSPSSTRHQVKPKRSPSVHTRLLCPFLSLAHTQSTRSDSPGAHILYRAGLNHAPQHGRIIRTLDGVATITTTSATAEATAEQLAPYLPSGSEVMISIPLHHGPAYGNPPGVIEAPPAGLPPGRTLPATVLRDDSDTRWPPQYVVRLPDASSATVMHSVFTAVTLPPGSGGGAPSHGAGRFGSPMAGAAPDELPSAPPTLPGTSLPPPCSARWPCDRSRQIPLGMMVLLRCVTAATRSQHVQQGRR